MVTQGETLVEIRFVLIFTYVPYTSKENPKLYGLSPNYLASRQRDHLAVARGSIPARYFQNMVD